MARTTTATGDRLGLGLGFGLGFGDRGRSALGMAPGGVVGEDDSHATLPTLTTPVSGTCSPTLPCLHLPCLHLPGTCSPTWPTSSGATSRRCGRMASSDPSHRRRASRTPPPAPTPTPTPTPTLTPTLALTLTLPWFIFPHWGPKEPAQKRSRN